MYNKIKYGLAGFFYIFFSILFISNNHYLESFANKIENELVRPYTQRFSGKVDSPIIDPSDQNQASSTEKSAFDQESKDDTEIDHETLDEPNVTIIYVTATPFETYIPEGDLWIALTTYRSAHGKSDIQLAESLCKYARKRANDLTNRLQTNPDDPLDNHAGFSQDAESGYLFETTGYSTVGENLAYTPAYTTATQIIEWGWDTSPNHRSLQLSSDITHGCISGIHPVYVGIYTY